MTDLSKIKAVFGHIIAAKVNLHDQPLPSLITPIDVIKGNQIRFFWESGPTYCTSSFVDSDTPNRGEFCILHDYGKPKTDQEWEKIDLHFLKTYYPVEAIEPTKGNVTGWIAPDGKFYLAHYGDHDTVARNIWVTLHNEVLPRYEARERLLETWIQANNDHVVGRNDLKSDQYDITVNQALTIDKINAIIGGKLDYSARDIVND